jgi:2-oxoglutarate ferredoxin oxidoreductase subunit gamma
VNVLEIPVNDIANQQGSLRVANVVMLGAYITLSNIVNKETILEAIQEVLGQTKQHLLDINVKALEEGIKFATTS